MTKTNEEIEAGIVEILKSHYLPLSTAPTSQAREHAKRVAGFYRSVARKLDALTADATAPTDRAEGFWWVRERGAEGWTAGEVRLQGRGLIVLFPGESRFMLESNPHLEWGSYLGKGPQ